MEGDYNTSKVFTYLKIFRTQQKVIFSEMTFIAPSSRNCSGNNFYNTKFENFGIFLRIWGVKFRNFTITAKGHFRGFDFYNTKYTPPHPLGDKPLGDRALLIGFKSRDQRLSTLISADSVAPNT